MLSTSCEELFTQLEELRKSLFAFFLNKPALPGAKMKLHSSDDFLRLGVPKYSMLHLQCSAYMIEPCCSENVVFVSGPKENKRCTGGLLHVFTTRFRIPRVCLNATADQATAANCRPKYLCHAASVSPCFGILMPPRSQQQAATCLPCGVDVIL